MTTPDLPNFRDAGGVGSLRPGLVFRGPQLSGLTPEQARSLAAMGSVRVFDLRTADEVAHRPDELPASFRYTLLDVLADRPHSGAAAVANLVTARDTPSVVEDINDAVSGGRARDLMIETYRYLVSLPSAHDGYRTLFTALADDAAPSIIHCTAGKDRTGWAIAVLQWLCGASDDEVLADYLASNAGMERAYGAMLEGFAAEGGDAAALADMIYVQPDYLDAAVTLMRRVHGDLHGYLTEAVGLEPGTIDRLRGRLSR